MREDIYKREVVEGDCLKISLKNLAVVEGKDLIIIEVTVLFKTVSARIVVKAIV